MRKKGFLCVWATSIYRETFVWTTGVFWEKRKIFEQKIGFVYRLCDIKKKSFDVYTKKGFVMYRNESVQRKVFSQIAMGV